jgi:hypothetical protein
MEMLLEMVGLMLFLLAKSQHIKGRIFDGAFFIHDVTTTLPQRGEERVRERTTRNEGRTADRRLP